MALLYKERAEGFGGSGDFESERENYILAAKSFIPAVSQLSGAPDVITIYQLLGDCYERAKMYQDAILGYQDFLRNFSDADEAETFRSFIVQLQKRMNGEQ